ncbi:MAG: hypothetical protein IKK21_10570 [Clostridia bacterium]|nr:hypothetical protein [Clostridia bacterium]
MNRRRYWLLYWLLHFFPAILAMITFVVCAILDVSGIRNRFVLMPLLMQYFYVPLLHLPYFGKSRRGWRFYPGAGRAFLRASSVCIDYASLPTRTSILTVQAPFVPQSHLQPRSGSSGLLMCTAAGLTIDAIDPRFQELLRQSLSGCGMQPERTAARWAILQRTQLFGCEAVIVQDGKGQRFFLTGAPAAVAPHLTHVWDEKEQPLTDELKQQLEESFSRLDEYRSYDALDRLLVCYCTGEWTENGPAKVTYLGGCTLEQKPLPEISLAALRCPLPKADTLDSDVLLITGSSDADAPLRMCCEGGEPTAFPQALEDLNRSHRAMRTSYWLLLCFGLFMAVHLNNMCDPMFPSSSFLCLILAVSAVFLRRGWQVRLPHNHIATLLMMRISALLSTGMKSLYPTVRPLLCAIPAFAFTCGFGLPLLLLLRQKKKCWVLIIWIALNWFLLITPLCSSAMSIVFPATPAIPAGAAFGSVLGLLWLLPWCVVKFE